MSDLDIILSVLLIVLGCYLIFTLWRMQQLQIQCARDIEELQAILDSKAKSSSAQRSTIKGQLAEQFYPLMPENNHEPSDMRFMGDFCDFIAIDGYTQCKDEGHEYIDGITFIEIKTGKAQLSRHQKLIRDAVQSGRVKWETIRLP